MSNVNNLDPYELLANAIVLQAVKDYRESVRKLASGRKNTAAEDMKKQCERFFLSDYFNTFTGLDGKTLLYQLESEVVS